MPGTPLVLVTTLPLLVASTSSTNRFVILSVGELGHRFDCTLGVHAALLRERPIKETKYRHSKYNSAQLGDLRLR